MNRDAQVKVPGSCKPGADGRAAAHMPADFLFLLKGALRMTLLDLADVGL
jgi:hypothetical protein